MALITGFIAFKAIDIIIKNKFENEGCNKNNSNI